jgi:hypothetical protein
MAIARIGIPGSPSYRAYRIFINSSILALFQFYSLGIRKICGEKQYYQQPAAE